MFNRSILSARRSVRRSTACAFAMTVSISMLAVGCAPEVGSEGWCKKLKETPKADWSANEAVDYAKHCLL